ncbi:MAG: ATP synthase F1 subunit delta [bacterium]
MKETVLARRYAHALFELAVERGILESISNEVVSFENTLQSNRGFRLFLYSQGISKKEKRAKIEEALQDKVSNVFVNFLHVLLEKNRERVFPTIATEFRLLLDNHHKRTRASTITAVRLEKKTLAKLKSILDKAFDKDVQIDNHIDESILGGIVVNVDGRLLDGSLRSQLRRLESQLLGRTNSKH